MVGVFWVSAHCDSRGAVGTGVEGVDGAERVDDGFVVGERSGRTGLEGGVVAAGGRVEGVDGAEEGVGVFAAAAVVLVDVGVDVLAVPEALEEAQDVGGLGFAARTGFPDLLGEDVAFDEGAVLHGGCEEGGALDFFPEVEGGFVPVLSHVGQIVGDDGPDGVCDFGCFPVVDKTFGVGNQCCNPQGRSISLRTSPRVCKGNAVDLELWLSKSGAIRKATGRVGYSL